METGGFTKTGQKKEALLKGLFTNAILGLEIDILEYVLN